MATYNKFNIFVQNVGRGVMNLNADILTMALSNTAPVATNQVLADITQIAGGTGYTTGGTNVPNNAYSQTSGTATLVGDSITWTATGSMGPLRYVVLYDNTPTSPADPLISWWDYGSSITLATGETFQVKENGSATGGTIFTMT